MAAFFPWLETTGLATTVRDSLILTGTLSAVHLLGFTLVTGGALVSSLRLLHVLFRDRPVLEIARPASRGIAVGLVISIVTGALLFAPRATAASINPTFQLKMLLLAMAAVFHFTIVRVASRRPSSSGTLRVVGATCLLLWTGVALAGCAFILLE